jgi:hypothetical protein
MFWRFVAGSFVACWLLLLGIDVSGDAGLIQHYLGSEADRAIDSVLADYGQATKIVSNEARALIAPTLVVHSAAFPPCIICCISTAHACKKRLLPRQEIPIYKFHLALRI